MKTVRLVLITIGLGLAAVLTAGAQAGSVDPHAGHTVITSGGLVDVVREVTPRENPHGTFADFNPRVSCDQFTQNPQ